MQAKVLFSCDGDYDLNNFVKRGFWHTRTELKGVQEGDLVVIKYNAATLKKKKIDNPDQFVVIGRAKSPMRGKTFSEQAESNYTYKFQVDLEDMKVIPIMDLENWRTVMTIHPTMRGARLL